MALPYIIGSSVFALIGGISFKFLNNDNNNTINNNNINDSINYSLIDKTFHEIIVSSETSPSLGITFAQKSKKITEICKEHCGFDCNNGKNKQKNRQKLLRYIREYERIGLNEFVKNHKKKNYLKNKQQL